MSTLQLTGANFYDTQMVMHTITRTSNASLACVFQKHLSNAARKHGVIDQEKYKKWASKRKWTEREYHVHNDDYIAHKYVKMFCNTNQFPPFPFCGPHRKPHGVRQYSKYYHIQFDPKLGHGICSILRIPFYMC